MDIPHELGVHILFFLPFTDVCTMSRVSRAWKHCSDDDRIWRSFCDQFVFETDPASHPRSTFASRWKALGPVVAAYPRIARLERRLRSFLAEHSPSILRSLAKGVPVADHVHALGRFDPESNPHIRELLALYSLVGGQVQVAPDADEAEENGPPAMFGTFECYGDVTNPCFLHPSNVQNVTLRTVDFSLLVVAYCRDTRFLLALVARAPARLSHLLGHLVNVCSRGELYVDWGTVGDWLEGYCKELEEGDREVDALTGQISMFKNTGKGTSLAVTRGIEVHVSSLPVLQQGNPVGQWSYGITIRSVPGQFPYATAQLESRRWTITFRSGRTETVEGRAVVGHFPIVGEGREPFSYRSYCTGQSLRGNAPVPPVADPADPFPLSDPPVKMSGSFTFVPGTIREPTGEKFEVQVAEWEFVQPGRLRLAPRLITAR